MDNIIRPLREVNIIIDNIVYCDYLKLGNNEYFKGDIISIDDQSSYYSWYNSIKITNDGTVHLKNYDAELYARNYSMREKLQIRTTLDGYHQKHFTDINRQKLHWIDKFIALSVLSSGILLAGYYFYKKKKLA